MSETCETVTVAVRYYLDVQKSGTSGTQTWGPFATRAAAEDVVRSLATVASVDRVTVRQEPQA